MPSGAKKRKAAKKKMESGGHTNTHHPSGPGIDEVKTQEGVSQDQSPFDMGGDDLEKRDTSPVGSFSSGSKSMEGATGNGEGLEEVIVEGEGVVEVVRELESHGGAGSDDTIMIENFQSSKGSLHRDDNSSTTDSSDDESRVNGKKEREESSNSVVEESSFADMVSKQVNQLIEEATAVEISSLHHKDDTSSSSNLSDAESLVDEKKVTEEACNSAAEEISSSTVLVPEEANQPREEAVVEEVFTSVLEKTPDSDTVEPVVTVSEEVIHVKECVSIQNSVASALAVSVLKENGEKLLPKSNGLTGDPPTEADPESKNVEDKAFPISNKNGEASSNVGKSAPEESEGKLVSSTGNRTDESSNGTGHAKSSEIPEYPENEHRLPVVAPRPVQTTSWKGCCGLFEVLVGSSR